MLTETELALEQTQQSVSYEVSVYDETWAEKDYDEFQKLLFFKFDPRTGLEVVLEGGPWLILFEEDGISLIATFIGKPVMLDSYIRSMCNESWGISSFPRCLIKVNSEAGLVDVVTIGIPSLSGDGPPIVTTSNVVTPTVEKTNDGFQTVGKKKKRKGKSKPTNGGQFVGPSVKQNVRYEPKETISAPKKGVTNVGNTSQSSSMLKMTGNSFKKDNLSMSNSFSALNDEEEDDEEDVENVYDESANLIQNTKAGGRSSFTAAAG
ncbi:hypothetical protein Tco_1091591 [Tanacetum coccineum]|uniref:Uncharacterized protein n=1 Tax=Tanacetum coccineum TaxID=301880 RepID=A0ABQ5I7K9_9ASTR